MKEVKKHNMETALLRWWPVYLVLYGLLGGLIDAWPVWAEWMSSLWSCLTGVITITVWGFLLLCAGTLLSLYLLARIALDCIPENQPAWLDFREKVIEGVVWRWEYDANSSICCLLPFCPKCDFQLKYGVQDQRRSNIGYLPGKVGYICEDPDCSESLVKEIDEAGAYSDPDGLYRERVVRKIQQTLRSDY